MENGKMETSRRGFLKGAALSAIGLGAAGMGLAGCAPKSDGNVEGSAPAAGSDASAVAWDEEFDVVIIGAGAAGMTAAITVAREGNGKSCLLAEKETQPNGNSPFCAGDFSWTTVPDDYYVYLKELAGEHTTTPDEVLRVFANGLGQVKDWVVELGALEEEMQILPNGTAEDPVLNIDVVWPELECSYAHAMCTIGGVTRDVPDYQLKGAPHIFTWLTDLVNSHSDVVDYRRNFAMEELIQDSTGRIVGAVIDGKNIKANDGVIMCCGGFENDPVLKENTFGVSTIVPAAGIGNTGDGHRACMKIGADFWHMSGLAGMWLQPRDLDNTKFTSVVVGGPRVKKYGITVGSNGRRFYMDYDALTSWPDPKPGYEADLRTDVGMRYGHTNFGGAWPWQAMPADGGWFIFDQAGLEAGAIPAETSTDPVADKLAYRADSLADLAAQINVPAEELEKTVTEWNRFCDEGEDFAFHRPPETLTKVAEGPFYAQFCAPTLLNTDGGPVRSHLGEIMDPFGKPIPGLYSAGEFGSLWGHFYQGSGNIAECLIYGRIAAESAMGVEVSYQ
ncbi:FAD-binding protein [Eggerthellaceae bacterium 24-137]